MTPTEKTLVAPSVDPITAHHLKAIQMVTDSLFPRKEHACSCGGTARFMHFHWECEACGGMWAD